MNFFVYQYILFSVYRLSGVNSEGVMAHRLLRDAESDGWERTDFPIVCESCLGDNPYVRMARAGIDYESSYGKVRPSDTILELQRTTPYYKRNRAHVCSFFIRGHCTRGPECPYRHEMPETGELSQQNIKDRYYGINDPVALKLLGKAGEMPSLEPPEDESIRTLYVGGLDARITEQDLRDQFYAHGEIESVKMVLQCACAFVTYTTREGTEKAAEELANKLVIKGLRLKLLWGRPQAPKMDSEGPDEAREQAAVAHSGLLPRAIISQQQNPPVHPTDLHNQPPPPMPYFNIPPLPQQDRAYYPSMDPQRMGALVSSQEGSSSASGGSYESSSQSELKPQQSQHYGYSSAPPPHGHFHQPYHPPYGYMPPHLHPPPPQFAQPYQSIRPPPLPGADQSSSLQQKDRAEPPQQS